MSDDGETAEPGDPAARPLCPSCMAPNEPGAHVCEKCRAPLSMFATVDPLETIRSQGWAYRQAASGRRVSKVILIGMWLIFAPAFFVGLLLLTVLSDAEVNPFGLIVFLFLLLLYTVILYKVSKHYFSRRREAGEQDGDEQ